MVMRGFFCVRMGARAPDSRFRYSPTDS
jgi:hypothetical protein